MRHDTNAGQVNASSVAQTVGFALSRGLSVERIETVTGHSIMKLIVPHGRVPINVRHSLWTELSTLCDDRVLSLEITRSTDLAVFDGLADAMSHAPDLRTALRFLVKNRPILGDHVQFNFDETDQTGTFFLSHETAHDGDCLAGEAGAVMIVRMLSKALGRRVPMKHLAFASGAHGPLDAYRRALGIAPAFERGRAAMIAFDKPTLDLQPQETDQSRFQVTELYFDLRRRLVDEPAGTTPLSCLSGAVTRRIEQGDYTAHGVAREANMSTRSAQRLAALHGKTLRSLIDDARASKAQHLMSQDPEAPIDAVAHLTGYSDERAFRRAFHRWTKMTPSQFKRLMKRPTTVV